MGFPLTKRVDGENGTEQCRPELDCCCLAQASSRRLGPCQRDEQGCFDKKLHEEPHEEHEGHEEHEHGHGGGHGGHGPGGHGHGMLHLHGERTRDRKRLLGALALTSAMMVGEVVGGFASGSLALLSDAGHMLTDAAALLLALLALWFAGRPADTRRTYGFFRLEILSALLNGLALILLSGIIVFEAFGRIAHPQPIRAGLMLAVAAVGLLVNIGGMAMLSHSHSMNVRGAFLHVLGDALSSVGVILAAAVSWVTGWTLLDPLISIGIALVVGFGAVGLIRQAVHVLIEGVPEHIDLAEVFESMKELEGVGSVHDLHVWTIANNMHALSAHIVVRAGVEPVDHDHLLLIARERLHERFGIDHATLQIESEDFAKHYTH